MKIGLISQWYPPEGAFVPGNLAEELAERGHQVRVLTTFPSYPMGRIYPGYRQRWNDCTSTGRLTVRRVPAYPSHDESGIRRAASYLSFGLTSAIAGLRYLAGVDVTYVYHPPPTSAAAAVLARAARRTPMVLHIQDMWPESVLQSGMAPEGFAGRRLAATLTAGMRHLYATASAIVVISPTMADLVIERGGDPAKVRVVLNWTDERLFRPVPATDSARSMIGHSGRCTIMFAGNLGRFQRIETAIRAAAAVRDRVDLVLVGSGADEDAARRLAIELDASNIRFIGQRSPDQMAELYAVADYQLVCLRDLPMLRGTIPSKLQAALASGRPVIMSAAGDAARLTSAADVGLSCPPEDWRALAECFATAAGQSPELRAQMGRRAREFYQERMSLRAGVDQFEDMLAKAAAGGGST